MYSVSSTSSFPEVSERKRFTEEASNPAPEGRQLMDVNRYEMFQLTGAV